MSEVEEACCAKDTRAMAPPELYEATALPRPVGAFAAPVPARLASYGRFSFGDGFPALFGYPDASHDTRLSKVLLEEDFPAKHGLGDDGWIAQEFEWEIELVRTATLSDLGIGVFATPHALLVQNVAAGMLEAWNIAHPEKEVRRGSVIMEVNGSSGEPNAILHALRYSRVLNLKLKRVPRLKVLIEKGNKLGLDVHCKTMEVQQVKETGSIDIYNEACEPGYQMIPGDIIVGVNEIWGDADQMLDEIYAKRTLLFHISRD